MDFVDILLLGGSVVAAIALIIGSMMVARNPLNDADGIKDKDSSLR